MAESHIISGLIKKRSEIAGQVKYYEKLITNLKSQLLHIDNTIHIFDNSYNLGSIKSKKYTRNRYFAKGESLKLILDTLRNSNTPLKTDEITKIIANKKGLELSNKDFINFQRTIVNGLNNCKKKGLISKVGQEGLTNIWSISSP